MPEKSASKIVRKILETFVSNTCTSYVTRVFLGLCGNVALPIMITSSTMADLQIFQSEYVVSFLYS
jgi:hypothetical protein